jgi:tellurite resistance protein TerB
MGWWDKLKEKAAEANESLKTNIAKFKNSQFAEGSMAMCALVAAADGAIAPEEKRKIAGLIMANDALKVFKPDDLKAKFEHYCGKLTADFDFGKIEAIQALGKLKSNPDAARALIQIGIIIGGADGTFDEAEKKVVKEACRALGIPPEEFDLV